MMSASAASSLNGRSTDQGKICMAIGLKSFIVWVDHTVNLKLQEKWLLLSVSVWEDAYWKAVIQ